MAGLKVFIESLVLLFAWVLVIYCQDFFSLLVFITLCVYTFTLTRNPGSSTAFNTVVKFCSVTLVIVYLFTLANMSSYNSPRELPHDLFATAGGKYDPKEVYPNTYNMIYSIPVSMKFFAWYGDKNVPHGV